MQMDALAEQAGFVAEILRTLGNESRLLILCTLAGAGEMTAGSLTGLGGLGQSALSQHLARLRADGIVSYRREGQVLWYRIADERVERLMAVLREMYCGPAER